MTHTKQCAENLTAAEKLLVLPTSTEVQKTITPYFFKIYQTWNEKQKRYTHMVHLGEFSPFDTIILDVHHMLL